MPDYDAGFKIVARESGRDLAMLGDIVCDQWASMSGEVHATERLADRAFQARRGSEKFIVYMEAYTRWETKAPWSVLAKSGLLSERERLPCVSLMYILLPRGYQPQDGTFRMAVDGQATQQVWFREICLWKLNPEPSWEKSPGLMALSPLFHQEQGVEQTIAHAARCIKGHASDKIREADLLTVLAVFGKLTHPECDAIHVIGREAMKESSFFEEIQNEVRQGSVLQALEVRFGKLAANQCKKEILAVQEVDDLSDLHRGAIKCRTIGGFRKLLAQKLKSQPAS